MSEKLSIIHQKVKENYLDLFTNKSIANKKNDARNILESILNYLLLKYLNVNIEEITEDKTQENIGVDKRINMLIKKNRVNKKLRPGLLFINKEGNQGSHPNTRPDNAGEETYVDAMIICLKPLIKDFFAIYGYNTDFLNTQKATEVRLLESNNQQLKQQLALQSNKEQELTKKLESENETVKKNRVLTIASLILGGFLLFGTIYIFSVRRDLSSKETNIESLIDSKKHSEEIIRRKNSIIDSLKRVVLVVESKEEKNFGIKNEFKGGVGTVENHQTVNNLDDLD